MGLQKKGLKVHPRVIISNHELYEDLRRIAIGETLANGREVTIAHIVAEIIVGLRPQLTRYQDEPTQIATRRTRSNTSLALKYQEEDD